MRWIKATRNEHEVINTPGTIYRRCPFAAKAASRAENPGYAISSFVRTGAQLAINLSTILCSTRFLPTCATVLTLNPAARDETSTRALTQKRQVPTPRSLDLDEKKEIPRVC